MGAEGDTTVSKGGRRKPQRSAVLRDVASHLPSGRLTNHDIVDTSGRWTPETILEKTGIGSRRMVDPDEFTSDLAVRAAERLFERHPDAREDLDYLFLTTVTPDYIVPSTGPLVQDRLGLPPSVGAFDVTLGCSGYTYGLTLGAALVESGRADRVLLLTADCFTRCTALGDHGVRTIIGDGATASLIEAATGSGSQGARIAASLVGTDGAGASFLRTPTSGARGWAGLETDPGHPVFEMDGPEVFNFTLSRIVPHVREFLAGESLTVDDVDLFVFHQANLFMLRHLQKRLGIPDDRFAVRIEDVGNTVSSSIPLALETALAAGRVGPGARVVLCGFGVGLSWGSVLLEYPG